MIRKNIPSPSSSTLHDSYRKIVVLRAQIPNSVALVLGEGMSGMNV